MANLIHTTIKTPGGPFEKPCVYRMNFGKRFFIWKCKNLHQSLKTISKDLERKINVPPSEDDLFCQMAAYMRRFRVYHISVDVLLATDDHQQLIDFERLQLEQSQGDPNCCNTVFVPHIPAWIAATPNKAPELIKKVKAEEIPQNVKKVPQIEEKPLPVKKETPASTGELEMPDLSADDFSAMIQNINAGKK